MNKKDVPNSDKLEPTESRTEWVEKIAKLAQKGVKKELAERIANGHSIHYEENGKLIVENNQGKFEYKRTENGTEIVGKLK